MASWSEVEAEAPELAARAKRIFDAHVHKAIATLRRDGSPRISGIELEFRDGDAWIGSMWKAEKALDLRGDPRFALHSASDDPPEWEADAKIAGRAEEVTNPEHHLFRLDVSELVVTGVNEARDKLVIESWHQDRGLGRLER
jgi:Pyridoxamine 5'-phosphate oxidase